MAHESRAPLPLYLPFVAHVLLLLLRYAVVCWALIWSSCFLHKVTSIVCQLQPRSCTAAATAAAAAVPAFPYFTGPQIRHGVLGFEMEQLLPRELGASIADLQQQQQQQGDGDDDSLLEFGSGVSGSELSSQLRSSGSVQLGERQRYREAAEKIRDTIAAGRQELQSKVRGEQEFQTSWALCRSFRPL
jgi:hypothetical protein